MTVEELWRYPVASMAGEPLPSLVFGEHGRFGDRALALIDTRTGRVASAKLPRRWGGLIDCSATRTGSRDALAVTVRLPGGSVVDGPGSHLDDAPTRLLGVSTRLVSAVPKDPDIDRYWPNIEGLALKDIETTGRIATAAPGTFFDRAPVHLMTRAALASVRIERTGTALDACRFRVIGPTPRCIAPTQAQGGLPVDPGLLPTLAVRNTMPVPALGMASLPGLGLYATIVSPGAIATGATVAVA